MVNLTSMIAYHATRTPEREAVLYGDERVTFAQLLDRAQRVGGGLKALGIESGDIVAVMMKNSAAFLDLALGTSHVGAIFLPINFRLSNAEAAYIVRDSGARLLLVDAELVSLAVGIDNVLIVDEAAQVDGGRIFPDSAPIAAVPRKTNDIFRLMYTSGTTDHPKGVIHSYENFYWKCADHALALDLDRDTRLLVTGPLYHVGAFDLPGIAVLAQGGLLCVQRDFSPAAVLHAIAVERLTGAWLAPVMTTEILGHCGRHTYDVSSLRWVIGGGERTPESRIRSFKTCFTNARYIDAYGLTETCSGDTMMDAGREIEKIGSTGRALAHVEIRICDEDGTPLPVDIQGEICLRGPKVTPGYWRQPEKTRASFFGDWFRTGDVGYLDSEGFLFLTDRKKDMIISGGENIAASEVERVILELEGIREVAVIGVPDQKWGERPVAVVSLADGAKLSFEGLAAHCRSRLAAFKVPSRLVFRDRLPRNPSGKVLKRVLREELGAE